MKIRNLLHNFIHIIFVGLKKDYKNEKKITTYFLNKKNIFFIHDAAKI